MRTRNILRTMHISAIRIKTTGIFFVVVFLHLMLYLAQGSINIYLEKEELGRQRRKKEWGACQSMGTTCAKI